MNASEFFDRFRLAVREDARYEGEQLAFYYRDNSKFTEIINKIIIGKIIESAECYVQHEYFRIDAIGWQDKAKKFEEECKRVGLKSYLWDLKIAVEHENDKTDWVDEVIKLTHIKCPLKVIIGYNHWDCRDDGEKSDDKKLDMVARMIQEVKAFRLEDEEEYLIILGNAEADARVNKGRTYWELNEKGFGYRGYIFNSTTCKFKRIEK